MDVMGLFSGSSGRVTNILDMRGFVFRDFGPECALFTFVTDVTLVSEFERVFHEMAGGSASSSDFFAAGDDGFARWNQFAKNHLVNMRSVPNPSIRMPQPMEIIRVDKPEHA